MICIQDDGIGFDEQWGKGKVMDKVWLCTAH